MEEKKEGRTNIEDLPKAEEELTPDEAKDVQGGHDSFYGTGVYKSTDSGKTWSGTTVGGALADPSDPSKR